jgi:hypothetical protein
MHRSHPILRSLLALALAASAATAMASDANDPLATFSKALASGDSTEKREAMRALSGLGKEKDDQVLSALVQAVGDRQTHDEAVMALRSRIGMEPTINNRGTGYPGYPNSDEASDWSNWLAQRTKDKEQQKKIAENAKKLKELEEKEKKDKDKKDGKDDKTAKEGDQAAPTEGGDKPKAPVAAETPSDLGKPDRIIFKTGGSLVCYILSKRTDSNGVVQSVRLVHLDGGGEETIPYDLISRIDEDIR